MDPGPCIAFVMEQHLGHRTYADNLRRALDSRPVRTAWVPVDYGPTTRWWERVPQAGLRSALRGRTEVVEGLRAVPGGADVCVFNTQVPAVLGGRAARRRPFVLCTDVTPVQYDAMAAGYHHRADRAGPGRWVKRRINTTVFQAASAHAPWSNWVRTSLIDDYGVDASTIEVIPPGVETSAWTPAEHTGDGPMKVLFVGGDFVRKGGEALLDAVATLPAGAVEVRVVTRSDVPARAGVRWFRGLDQNSPELKELFRTSDVFVLPSGSETFGIAAVEGAAAGLPLVVSRVGGLEDLVVEGVTGHSVTPGDRGALAAALGGLLDRPDVRRRMGAAARARAEAEFDASKNADRLVRLALSSLERSDRPS